MNLSLGYYECSICGHISQKTAINESIIVNEYGDEVTVHEEVLDGEASFLLAIKHEEKSHDIK